MSGAFTITDRIKETTATTGTGTINLAGAVTAFQSFSVVGTGNFCSYTILSGDGTSWECGVGVVTTGSPNTLSRPAANVTSGSSGLGTLISLSGTSTVFADAPAAAFRASLCAPIVPPTAATNWTQKNFGASTTLTDVANGVCLYDASTASPSEIIRGAILSAPSTPYTIDVSITGLGLMPAGTNYYIYGVGWTDGTKVQAIYIVDEIGISYSTIAIRNSSNYTTYNSSSATVYGFYNMANGWLRIADSGTNATLSISTDGVSWFQVYTVAKSSGYLGSSGYSNVGLFFNSGYLGNGGSGSVTLRSWWQH